MSGFRIDLAIVDPDAPGAFLAGVECDGATYHSSASARDRDRLRQIVLEKLDWRILRIWSTDWWTNAGRQTERLHVALGVALATARERRTTPATPLLVEGRPDADIHDPVAIADPKTTDVEQPKVHPIADLESDLLGSAPEPERFYDDLYGPYLAEMIKSVLEAHGPLRQDRLHQRIARAHGFQRTGSEIQSRIVAATPDACVQSRDDAGTFIWPAGAEPAACNHFRRPAAGDTRDPAEIAIEELTVLARDCLREAQDDDGALIMMRDACGLQKLREVSRTRCRMAITAANFV